MMSNHLRCRIGLSEFPLILELATLVENLTCNQIWGRQGICQVCTEVTAPST
jgi:hypothetical protein